MWKKRGWLTDLRMNQGISIHEMGELSGLKYRFIHYLETGARIPSVKSAKKIAKVLNFEKHGLDWTRFYENVN